MTHNDTDFVLPERPLKVLRTGALSSLLLYAASLLLIAVGLWYGWASTPKIWQDWQIRQDPVEVANALIQNGECTTSRGIINNCKATIIYNVDRHKYRKFVEFSFLDDHKGDWSVTAVRSKSHPELVTLDIGLDKLWNRTLFLAGMVILFVGVGIQVLLRGRKSAALKALNGKTAQFSVVKVAIKKPKHMFGKKLFYFSLKINGKKHSFISAFKKQETPLYTDNRQKEAFAALPTGGSVPVLLDSAFTRLDFTEEEADKLRRFFQAESA